MKNMKLSTKVMVMNSYLLQALELHKKIAKDHRLEMSDEQRGFVAETFIHVDTGYRASCRLAKSINEKKAIAHG